MGRAVDRSQVGRAKGTGRRAGRRQLGRRLSGSVAAAMFGIVLIAAGCGGSSGASSAADSPTTASVRSTSTTSIAPDKTSYDARANAICKTFNAKLQSVGAALSTSTSLAQFEVVLNDAISVAQGGINRLQALHRPAAENAALEAAYKSQEAQLTDVKGILAAVKANSITKVRAAIAVTTASDAPLNKQFDALGLTACGSGKSAAASA